MIYVLHTLGDQARFALVLGVLAGVLAWFAVWLRTAETNASALAAGVRVALGSAATISLAVSILGVRPGGSKGFPATGDPIQWHWRWLGDIPDATGSDLLSDYTAAIAFLNFALFVVWAVVVTWAMGPGRRRWAVASAILFPVCLEALQRYPFGGTPSTTDAWTNILGALLGVALWSIVSVAVSLRGAGVTESGPRRRQVEPT